MTSRTSPTGPAAPTAPGSSRSTRCTRPCPAARPTPPRTGRPRGASRTRCTCGSRTSPSTQTAPAAGPSTGSPPGARELRRQVLEKGALIDRDAVWELKRQALELLYAVPRTPERDAAYAAFRAEQGGPLDVHAAWCAAHAGEDPEERRDFHRWLVWLTESQLAAAQRAAREAGMTVGIVHDLAVGVHPQGSDASGTPHYAGDASVGAPPDAFNARGQDWGLPPWRPDRLEEAAYEPFRALLRGVFRYAGALRIDHVMGLFRLWWIPREALPAEGTYVSYDGEAMLAVLVLEAHRAGALVIGEDLGTVEPRVREALARRGVLGTSVLWFERDWSGSGGPLDPGAWRADCLATVTTHDLPPTAAKLAGGHVELRDRLGLLTRPAEAERAEDAADTAEWLEVLDGLGLDTKGEEAAVRALYGFLLRTPARLVGVWLPDAVGDRRPQNLPGTWDQYPNWRLPVADDGGPAADTGGADGLSPRERPAERGTGGRAHSYGTPGRAPGLGVRYVCTVDKKNALRAGAVTAGSTLMMLLMTSPALALTRDDGDDPGTGLSIAETVGLFVCLPIVLFLIIAGLVMVGDKSHKQQTAK
ncbi:hypothetical protein GCM10020254_54860 [Streptomyces goshikiensis]